MDRLHFRQMFKILTIGEMMPLWSVVSIVPCYVGLIVDAESSEQALAIVDGRTGDDLTTESKIVDCKMRIALESVIGIVGTVQRVEKRNK